MNNGGPSSKAKYILIIDSEKYCEGKIEKISLFIEER